MSFSIPAGPPEDEDKRADDDNRISLTDVSFIRKGRLILDAITWEVERGANWVVMGANGSGKTTLLQLLAGYLWPTDGSITVLGRKFGQVDLRELRKNIGWVGSFLQAQIPPAQNPLDLIVSGKYASIGIYDNPGPEDYEQAEQLAHRLHCGRILDSTYGVLSQGEKQRLLIARALIHNPRLLILDEPCSGLDLAAREQLLTTLENLGRAPDAPTLILVTHHVEEIMPAFTHVLLLKEGKIIARGEKRDALRRDLLKDAFGIDLEVMGGENGGRYWVRTPPIVE
ncbi:MAG: ABC transporter ATP-binding protein [Syntrophobacteraceae bacterium]